MTLATALALHHAVTWFLAGLIWVVQWLHYPMFAALDPSKFASAHAFHSRRITGIVAPAMTLELALAAYLVHLLSPSNPAAVAGVGLVLLNWIVTAFVMVPLHGRLASGDDVQNNIVQLVRWNWIRTIAWSARAMIAVLWL